MTHHDKRTLIIGDIHGCYKELKQLLKALNYSPAQDRLISLGDLIHKGPSSEKVIHFFYDNDLEVIMGNHEWHLLEALRGNCKMYPEAEKILKKLKIKKKDLRNWLEKLPYFIESEDFVAVHGSLDPSKKHFQKTDPMDMISGRYFDTRSQKILCNSKNPPKEVKPWYEVYPPEKVDQRYVISGHWAGKEIRQKGKFYCIDTGCCYGGKLSCFTLPEAKVYQVISHQERKFNY